jgi:ADP-ribose pyrophosphatase YjhB (NUDIX family)
VQYTSYVDVHLLLVRDERILLARRHNTGYADGLWNLPSGKLDEDEDLLTAMIRESREELDLHLDPADLKMVTAVHNLPPEGAARLGFFFHTDTCVGEPRNAERHKCSAIEWFPLTALPSDTVPYSRTGIEQWRQGETFGLLGWTATADIT